LPHKEETQTKAQTEKATFASNFWILHFVVSLHSVLTMSICAHKFACIVFATKAIDGAWISRLEPFGYAL